MIKVSKKIEYALMALKHMHEKNPSYLTSTKEVCETYHAPFDVMARVLQTLVQNRILRSEQGSHGGYRLACDLSDLNLLSLVESLSGPVSTASCLHDDQGCDLLANCNIVPPMERLNERMKEFYSRITIKELVGEPKHKHSEQFVV